MQGATLMVEGVKDTTGQYIALPTAPAVLHNIKYVVNMDGGIGNSLCVGCSGAVGGYYSQTFETTTPSQSHKYEIEIKGFTGGHSGNARNYLGNSLKAMNETLSKLIDVSSAAFEIASISTPGTTVYNVIPPCCKMVVSTNMDDTQIKEAFDAVIANHGVENTENYWKDGKNATITVSETEIEKVLSFENSKKIITLQDSLPYGRINEYETQGLKTSANIAPANLSIDNLGQFKYTLETYSRSDSEEQIENYRKGNKTAAQAGGFTILDSSFHSWKEEKNKKLYDLTVKSLNNIGIETVTPTTGHGGIEPAMWSWAMINNEGINDGNCVSLGVNVANEHKPTESIDVDSIQKCMKVLTYIFEHSKELI